MSRWEALRLVRSQGTVVGTGGLIGLHPFLSVKVNLSLDIVLCGVA